MYVYVIFHKPTYLKNPELMGVARSRGEAKVIISTMALTRDLELKDFYVEEAETMPMLRYEQPWDEELDEEITYGEDKSPSMSKEPPAKREPRQMLLFPESEADVEADFQVVVPRTENMSGTVKDLLF